MENQQQKSHYSTTLHPRKTMRIAGEGARKNNLSLNHHNKKEHEINRSRNHENIRLMKAIQSIYQDKGILGAMEERAYEIQKTNKKLTLVNEFKEKEKLLEVKRRNKELVNKIGHVRPSIGNVSSWDS